ncbi:MAG: hypothetical protein AB1773_01300 [Pseudomonadota bacterium]
MGLIAFGARGGAAQTAGHTLSSAAARGKRGPRHSDCTAVPLVGRQSKKD